MGHGPVDVGDGPRRPESNEAPSSAVKLIYFVACFTNIVINFDHGILPACTQELMRDTNINELQLGVLGSVVYIGLVVGSIVSGPMLQYFSPKRIIYLSVLGNMAALVIFLFSKNFSLLCLARGMVGFFQEFMVIYFPVWVDTFGKNKKTTWIMGLQLGVVAGMVLGYATTMFFVSHFSWHMSFTLQIVLYTPCFLAFFFFNEDNMATNKSQEEIAEILSEGTKEGFFLSITPDQSLYDDALLANDHGDKGPGGKIHLQEEDNFLGELGYFDYMRILWTKKVYIYTMLGLAVLYFIITGIQFWISDYMQVILKQQKTTVSLAFTFVSTVGSVSGVIIGGSYLNKIGGYTSKHALDFCLAVSIFASICAIPIPFLNNFPLVCILLFFLLGSGGALLPALIGIMLSSVPNKIKAMGYSIAQIVQNLLGYSPAPVLYGLVMDVTGGEESRYGMVMLMLWITLGVATVFAAKNAQIKKHQEYMKEQYQATGEEEIQMPDLFQPMRKDHILRRPSTVFDEEEQDVFDANNATSPWMRPQRARTLLVLDNSRRKSSVVTPKAGRLEQELQGLNQATVDYQKLRKARDASFLSKDDISNFSMMFGRVTVDKKPQKMREELL